MKVAIPVAGGQLCRHFGHCENFAVLDLDTESREITSQELLTPPPHEPGVLPRWLADLGVDLVLAGGMGARAVSLFKERGVDVCIGVTGGSAEEIARAWLQGNLEVGANPCDH
jgi:predicted Fe-Mo cluster-binding NifX family protein